MYYILTMSPISYSEMTDELKNIILRKIEEKSHMQENGCKIWTGCIDGNRLCRLNIGHDCYFPHNFIWDHYHQENQIDKKVFICVRSCKNNICIEPSHLLLAPRKQEANKEKIWSRILKFGERLENGCFIWTGSGQRYGATSVQGKSFNVHRVSYWIHNDDIKNIDDIPKEGDDGVSMMVRHKCNNPLCFEPTHLTLGTQYENDFDDKIENGTLPRGDTHYNASITEEMAKEIKHSKYVQTDPEYKTQKMRAEEFGVSLDLVKSIDCGKSWAHIPDKEGITGSDRKLKARGLRKVAKERVWTKEMFEEARKRLLENIILSKDVKYPYVQTPCHIWLRAKNVYLYGSITIFGKTVPTHILACEIKNGFHRPTGLVARHMCGNKECCNPDHMEFGTYSENSIDTVKHGTLAAKLSEEQVKEIRSTLGIDGMTKIQRAEKYGISTGNLNYIETNKTWKHIIDPLIKETESPKV